MTDSSAMFRKPSNAERTPTAGAIMPGRVAVFTGHYFPHVGGVERYTLELWGRLARRGWQVRVVTANTNEASPRELRDGLSVIRLPSLQVVAGRLPVILPSGPLVEVVRELRADPPDVIVTNTRFFSSSILGMSIAGMLGCPTLHIDHASEHVPVGTRVGDMISEAIDHSVGRWVLSRATRCVGVSRSVADFLGHLGRSDAGVLYNGVDSGKFASGARTLRSELGIASTSCVLLFVGRLIEQKGIVTLLDAFDRLPPQLDAHLVIAGDGPLRETVEQRTGNHPRIHRLGFVGAERVAEALADADVFVHPSAYPEGLPTSVLEAAAAGCAIVATPMGGTTEIVLHDHTGLIVPPRDSHQLELALCQLAASPARRGALGAAAQQLCRSEFEWERVADVAERELDALIAVRRS
jgi:glycosyltransferase involved in cell wall biosynthesis